MPVTWPSMAEAGHWSRGRIRSESPIAGLRPAVKAFSAARRRWVDISNTATVASTTRKPAVFPRIGQRLARGPWTNQVGISNRWFTSVSESVFGTSPPMGGHFQYTATRPRARRPGRPPTGAVLRDVLENEPSFNPEVLFVWLNGPDGISVDLGVRLKMIDQAIEVHPREARSTTPRRNGSPTPNDSTPRCRPLVADLSR